MKVTAITRYKHGELYRLLRKLGWSQSELARKTGYSAGAIGRVINLEFRPSVDFANSIQNAFAEAGEYFDVLEEWPETFIGIGKGSKVEQTMDVPMESLLSCHEAMNLPAPNPYEDEKEDEFGQAIDSLKPQQQIVIRALYFENKTPVQVKKETKMSLSRILQIRDAALRSLRHPSRIKKMESYWNSKSTQP